MGVSTHIKDSDIMFTDGVYAPEELLTEWLSVVFACMTSSLLFYHMTRVKSLSMDPRLSAFFSCGLIVAGILYNMSAIIPYVERMNHQLGKTKNGQERYKINRLKYTFVSITVLTVFIQFGICTVIIKNTMKYL
jgi:hypothetical protein